MGNLTTAGLNQVVTLLVEGQYATGRATFCVGNSATAFDASQEDLLGAEQYEILADLVTATDNFMTVTATIPAADAAFAWNEVGLKDEDGLLFTRYPPVAEGDAAIGTKPGDVEWEVVWDLEFVRS